MIFCRTYEELRATLDPVAKNGEEIGFVPTMGALHQGHAALLERSVRENARTVLSIFVNPTQFGPKEDIARYPRNLEADLKLAEACRVDVVYHPSVEDIYPEGFSTFIEVEGVSAPLCGEFRPGHFRGVATVVFQFFSQVLPQRAYFGQKDIQQCLVLSKMVKDVRLPVELVLAPTVRESDGLALSSRNRYLSVEEREIAPVVYRALQAGTKLREKSVPAILAEVQRVLAEAPKLKPQYVELLSFPELKKIDTLGPEGGVLAIAAYLGDTRLIDNLILRG